MPVTRHDLEHDRVRQALRDSSIAPHLLSERQLEASLQAALAGRPEAGELWVFAYGSLMWNPFVRFSERRIGTVFGYHRRFCLWSRINRGTPERPGLVLGLDRGGACTGVAYRIAEADVETELRVLWRREMMTGAYLPRWLPARSGAQRLRVLAFVMNRASSAYAGRLEDEAVLRAMQGTRGLYGEALDYLLRTAESLERHGIRDAYVRRLARRARSQP